MSALLQELATQGVTSEDIEKAAAARLFEKTAAAEGVDLNTLNEGQQNELFDYFVENTLPGMVGGEKSASAEYTEDEYVQAVMAKAASLSDDVKFALFEKQASYEGLDLDNFDDENLKVAYGYFLEDVLPGMVANDGGVVEVDGGYSEKNAEAEKVAEAQAKLAEAEILGRHMARAFHNESQKMAAGTLLGRAGELLSGSNVRKATSQGLGATARGTGNVANEARKVLAARGAAALGAAGLGAAGAYGVHRYRKNKADAGGKESTASAPIFESLAMQKAAEILEANGIDPTTGQAKQASIDAAVDARAIEILAASGYEFE
jgi:hypothetical protein